MRWKSILAFVAGLVLVATACDGGGGEETEGQGVDTVKIGVLLPLSGAAADYGAKLKNHAEFAAQEINEAGGISSLGGARIQLIFADTQALPDVGQSETERLILQEGVHGLIGCYNSSVTLPCTAVAERNQISVVVYSSVAEEITQRGFKYTFRPNETSLGAVETMFGFFEEQIESTGREPATYGVVFENTDFGKDTADNFAAAADAAGWQQILFESFQQGLADATPIALKVRSQSPDVLLTVAVTPDTNLLYRTFNQQDVRTPVMIDYAGGGQAEFDPLLADNEGLFMVSQWHDAVLESRPWLEPHINSFVEEYGEPPQAEGLQAYSDVYIWADALERAGSVDKEAIREALASTNLTEDSEDPALIMPYLSIGFDAAGQNPEASLMILQASGGDRVPVWPQELRPPDYEVSWMG
jgi:branched-chain amino acid transport system substrate-binding protein